MTVPAEIVEALAQLGAQSNGDVPALVNAARMAAPGPFADDALLARGCESAAQRAAERGDRGGAWWLACAVATLRASPLGTPQEEAELVVARVTGELSRSPAALAPLPEGARWLVAGQPEPPPADGSIELARRNATTYLERLEAELSGRAAPLRAKWEQAPNEGTRAAIEEALASYESAITRTRAALSRAIDHLSAKDPRFAARGVEVLTELDDAVIPTLRGRIGEVKGIFGAAPAPAPVIDPNIVERPSFAGAAPPAFQPGAAPPSQPTTSLEQLDLAMRAAFEQAWAAQDAASLAAFEQAVRARYEHETASIPDPEQRRQALDHYVAHAMAQVRRT